MFNFICQKCSRKCLSVGEHRCFHCIGESGTDIGLDENVRHQQTHVVTSRDTDVEVGSGSTLDFDHQLNITQKIQLNDQMTMKSGEVHRKSKQEKNCEGNDAFSSCSEGRGSRDFVPKPSAIETRFSFDCIQTEQLNGEPSIVHRNMTLNTSNPQSSSHHRPVFSDKEPSGSCVQHGRKTTQNIARPKRCRAKISTESGEDILNGNKKCEKTMKSGTASPTSINNRSLVNIGKKLSSGASDFGTFKGENANPVLAVEGPSSFHGGQKHRNSQGQMSSSNYVSEIPSVKMREQYELTCKVCKKKVGEHLIKERNAYRCCVCGFDAVRQVCLQMHSYTHCREKTCSICGKAHREGDLHDSEHTCIECQKAFHCRTRYGEHLLEHSEYLRAYCWACSKRYTNHWFIQNEKKIIACCFCVNEFTSNSNLCTHSALHRPKSFCIICREEYCDAEKNYHDGKFSCSLCSNNYQCQTQLEEHTRINHCIKEDTGLRLFKCEACGKRFERIQPQSGHSRRCMLYKCEICGAAFPQKKVLNAHRLEIHVQK